MQLCNHLLLMIRVKPVDLSQTLVLRNKTSNWSQGVGLCRDLKGVLRVKGQWCGTREGELKVRAGMLRGGMTTLTNQWPPPTIPTADRWVGSAPPPLVGEWERLPRSFGRVWKTKTLYRIKHSFLFHLDREVKYMPCLQSSHQLWFMNFKFDTIYS